MGVSSLTANGTANIHGPCRKGLLDSLWCLCFSFHWPASLSRKDLKALLRVTVRGLDQSKIHESITVPALELPQTLRVLIPAMLLFFLKYYFAEFSGLRPLDSRLGFLTAFVAVSVAFWLFWPWGKHGEKPTVHRFSDPAVCLKILRNLPYGGSLGANRLSHEVSRATPNQRLVRAFQIDNGFTTTDKHYGRQFKNEAVKQLRRITSTDRGGWSQIATLAHDIASTYFRKFTSNKRAGLDLIVQVVTLKVVLSTFFDIDPAAFTDGTALTIARMINLLWIQSKSETGSQSADFFLLKLLLQEIGLDWNDNKDSPLNILLPAYETLWRVVARCLVEVVFRPSADVEWRHILNEFRANPTPVTFSTIQPCKDNVTVEFLVNEALRLYPPTRRIYRHVHLEERQEPELLAADIEQCHRLPHIWGEDSHRYWPARWLEEDESMRKAFMPFGGGDWICPASSGFGTVMIGVLVASFARIISADDWELQLRGEGPDDCSQILDDETELNSDRHENTACEIVKRIQ